MVAHSWKSHFMWIVYDLIFVGFALMYFPYLFLKGKWHRGFFVRLGWISLDIKKTLARQDNIWIHAVSVGEVMVVVDLIRQLKIRFPKHTIVCSTVTQTGYQLAVDKLPDDIVIYAPLDFSWIARAFIHWINPKVYIAAETEIWPNLYTCLRKNNVPIVQINGRISDKSFKGYQRFRFLTKPVLECVHRFCMQSELDAKRIIQLGAQSEKVAVVGNLKFDQLPQNVTSTKQDFGFNHDDCVLVAGSTHSGEEEILLDVYKELSAEFPSLRLIIAPRHVERASDIRKIIESEELTPVEFLQGKSHGINKNTVMIIDKIGHLGEFYNIATIVFIGKTFKVGGGQNMIEPTAFGCPTIVGPHTQNFKDVMRLFLEKEAIIQVNTSTQLSSKIKSLLNNQKKRNTISSAAKQVIKTNQGATARTMNVIEEFIYV